VKIGVISDTHGQIDLALSAAREFIFRGVDAVVHCGDIGTGAVLLEMAVLFSALDIPIYAVIGNCDLQSAAYEVVETAGVKIPGRFADLNFAGHRVAVLHGDDEQRFETTVNSGDYDYIFFGHSHARHDETAGKTRLVNPGSAGRGMHPSGAVVDLGSGDVSFFTIRR